MNKIIFSLMLLVFAKPVAFSQSVGIGTTTPDASSVLELKSTTKGFLPPRMKASEKGLIPSPKAGLIVYQTDGTPGLYVYNGTAWVVVAGAGSGWSLTGNGGTNATNFIGTTDAKPLTFKTNGIYSGQINNNGMVALGTGAAPVLSDASIVAIGKNALLNNGTGASGAQGLFNTAIGSEALKANTTGLNNTGAGYNALISNTTGLGNTAAGASTLLSNTTGNDNTSVGNQSLFSNQNGYSNTATGVSALYANKTGANNTATGVKALFSNLGSGNTANGVEALKLNTTGNFNTALGIASLTNNVSGSYNTAIGISAMNGNTTGAYNTAIGYQAGVLTDNLDRATAIGTGAKAGCSDCVVLGDVNVKVGIGITNPTAKLHVNPNGAGGIYIGGNETTGGFTGLALGVTNKSGGAGSIQATQATGSLWGDLLLNPSGGQVGIGYTNQTSVQYPLDINQNGNTGIRLKNGDVKWSISANNVLTFELNGVEKSYIAFDGSYVTTSDARLKKDVNKFGTVLDKVMALQPKTYKYISNEGTKHADMISTGFIAQEVMPLFPNLVSDFTLNAKDSTDKTVYHGVDYAGFSVIAIKAIQEQQEQIETLKTTNTTLAAKLENVEAKLVKMQEAIEALQKK